MSTIPYMLDYKQGKSQFPSDSVPMEKRDENWHKLYAKAILAEYAADKCGVNYSERQRIENNRRFADGTNSEDLFKDIMLEFERDEKEKQGWTNIDFSIIPIISKFQAHFLGILGAAEHRVSVSSIDPISMGKKSKMKWTLWWKKIFQDFRTQANIALSIPEKEQEYLPETLDELNMYDQLGGFKLGIETAIEEAMNHCFDVSKWDAIVAEQIQRDFFQNNMMACKDYLDSSAYVVMQRYVDIGKIIVQYSKDPLFKNSRYFGEIVDYSIADLRVKTGWDEKKIVKIAQKFNGQYGNPSINNFNSITVGTTYGPYYSSNIYEYDPFTIPVAELEFASTIYKYDVERKDNYGNVSYYNTDYDRKYNDEKRKSITTPIKVWHKVSIPIGCEEVFDWGLQYDIPRPTPKEARSSFHFLRAQGKSLCERSQPHAKQIQLGYLQLQNHIAKAAPGGLMVEWKALTNIVLNNKDMEPMDLLKIRRQTGDIIYSATTARGTLNSPAANRPVQELKGGLGAETMLFVNLIDHHIQQIREITGVNDQIGLSPSKTATGEKLSLMATDVSLKTCYKAYLAIVEETATNAIARLRDLLSYSEKAREKYSSIIGMNDIEMLNVIQDLSLAEFSQKIDIVPSDKDKEIVLDAAIQGMKPGREGTAPLRISDFLLIKRLLDAGNIKFAQALMAYKEGKMEELAELRKRQNEEFSIKANLAQAEKKKQDDMILEQFKTNEEIRKADAISKITEFEKQEEHKRKLEQITLEKSFDMQKQEVQKSA